ncbi:putative zinc finger protein 286B [Microcaecilia unicolor]|uniref:Zinc finger protein 286B n=1 Tax=Microcaecilia unicolor TaxID=1415580 RepID=A0A6P7X4A7_9AMPH|nr:putative zinc finger protein 286B [Microcaecilia unicolor]
MATGSDQKTLEMPDLTQEQPDNLGGEELQDWPVQSSPEGRPNFFRTMACALAGLGSMPAEILQIYMLQQQRCEEWEERHCKICYQYSCSYFSIFRTGSQSYTAEPTVEFLKMEEVPDSDLLDGGEENTDTKRDDGFGNKSKRMRVCDGQQREEWKYKVSPDPSVDCLESISRVIPHSIKENALKGEKPNVCIEQESNSTHCANLKQNQRLNEETLLQSTVFKERFIGKSNLAEQNKLHRHCIEYGKYFTYSVHDKNFSQVFDLRRHELINTGRNK